MYTHKMRFDTHRQRERNERQRLNSAKLTLYEEATKEQCVHFN